MRSAVALLVVFWAGVARADVLSTPEAAVEEFQGALLSDDFGRFARYLSPGAESGSWTDLRDLISERDCVSIANLAWFIGETAADQVEIRIEMSARAATKAASRPTDPLPARWRLRLKNEHPGWSVASVMCEEHILAIAMREAASRGEATEMFAGTPGVDRSEVLRLYADEIIDARYEPNTREWLDHALMLSRSHGTLSNEIGALRALATVEGPRDGESAGAWARRAYELATTRGTVDDEMRALFTMGLVSYCQHRLEEASAQFARAAALIDRVHDPIPALKALRMQSFAEELRGSLFGKARANEAFLTQSSRLGWEEGVELALIIRSEIQRAFGNHKAALEDLTRSFDLTRASGNRSFQSAALTDLAAVELERGDAEAAVKNLEMAVALASGAREERMTMLTLLARVQLRRGALSEAEAILSSVIRSDPPNPSALILSSELELERGHAQKALEEARRATSLSGKTDVVFSAAHSLSLYRSARALHALGRDREAIADLEGAVELIESERRQLPQDEGMRMTFLADKLEPYVELVEALVRRGERARAFRTSELMKARALFDRATAGHIDFSASMSRTERVREEELEGELSNANRSVRASREGKARTDAEKELITARTNLERFRTQMLLEHPTLVRRRAKPDEKLALPSSLRGHALVEYVVGPSQTTALCLTQEAHGSARIRAVTIRLGSAELERRIRGFVTRIDERDFSYVGAARKLYRLLIAPVEREIGGRDLIIVPDRQLWLLPFQALVSSRGKHLVEERAVSYAPSLAILRAGTLTPKAPTAKSTLLAFANPARAEMPGVPASYRSVALGSLPDSETEVRRLLPLYDRRSSRAYFREQAREGDFKKEAGSYDVIHIAAHAIVDDRNPMYSAIVLADDGGHGAEDGLLEAREIVDLELKARLAILSACDTARGGVKMGEGVIGLSWALMTAGCPTTVVSQWRAESKATALLMVEFHRRLAAGDSPARAMRKAQRKLGENPLYGHPLYWAPFVVIGAP